MNTVESSSNISDRKLGMSLLIDKILSHVKAEECILYLFGDESATLQRTHSTGNIKDLIAMGFRNERSEEPNIFPFCRTYNKLSF